MLADYRTLVDQELQDTAAILSQAVKDKAIAEAVKEYSKPRPLIKVKELVGDGHTFEWAMPADWEDGFSAISADVEFPAGKRQPEYLEPEDWMLYRDPALGVRFRLLNDTPTANDKVRFPYTVRHTVDAATDTVPLIDREALGKLAASYGLRALATYYAQTADASLSADAVNYRSKAQDYSMLADKLLKAFREHLGIRETDQVTAASVSADMDVNLQPGGDRFYHTRRWR
jgi:hypothetical protein